MADFVYLCADEAATEHLARALANISKSGDTWALYGTLGMGKSVWARAFIKQLCEVSDVPSPTFTLVQTYPAAQFEIYHYDLYRLKSPEEIWELNMEEALALGVSLIEWPEKMSGYLPSKAAKLKFEPWNKTGRRITISVTDPDKISRLRQCTLLPDEFHE